jgi:DNA-binding IscR family transcriptional regulator
VRTIDGPLAPFGDAVELAYRVKTEPRHAGLFDLFLDVRNAAATILDHTSLQDLLDRNRRVLARRGRAARERP